MPEQRVVRSRIDDVRPIGAPGDRSFDFVMKTLREHLDAQHALLFAEPVLAPNGQAVDWITSVVGPVLPLSSLPDDEAEALSSDLADLLRDIRALAKKFDESGDESLRRKAIVLRNALSVPDQSSIYRVGGRPVLTRWAHRLEADTTPFSILSRFMGEGESVEQATISNDAPGPTSMHRARFTPMEAGTVVGRSPGTGQVVIDHPAISSRHAMYRLEDNGLVVEDLKSEAGTFVNGQRVTKPTKVNPGDRVDIGPYRLDYNGTDVLAEERAAVSGLSVRNLTRDVKISGQSEALRILDNVSIDIEPGEFICIIGPSGSGKSTLMNAMSGRVRPTSGQIIFNDFDLHTNFDHLKHLIAMVPQHNLLHEPLTLRRALGYTALLRLPQDMSASDRAGIVSRSAEEVGLEERLDTRIAQLSGGQKKRCSLANELLDRPYLLFLDEVTSGLDENTDMEIMALLRSMADQGMTIVCVTHTLANLEAFCDRIIVMDVGGVLTYAGPPAETLAFFGVERMGQVFTRLPERKPEEWRTLFDAGRLAALPEPDASSSSSMPKRKFTPYRAAWSGLRQTAILTHRNVWLLATDKRIWTMALLQSLLIGGLIGYAFSDFGPTPAVVQSKIAMLLLLGLAGLWIGCNTSSKDIVGEIEIFQRENDVNLSSTAFVMSKFLVSSLFTMMQMSIVFGLAWVFSKEVPGHLGLQWGFAMLAAIAGCCLGLLISAITNTTEQATTVVPLILVPQLILSGVIVPYLPEVAMIFAEFSATSFVLVESMKSVFIEADGPIKIAEMATGQQVDMAARHHKTGAQIVLAHCALALFATLQIMFWRQRQRRKAFS